MTLRIINADVLEGLKQLPDESVHCVVTSPPYYGLRDYGVDGQIGLEATPEAFIARLVEVFREVRRVLRKDGTCFINMGDSYVSNGGAQRAVSCDTPGTALAGSQASDCLCGNLCGACRAAYRLGKFHSDAPHAPRPSPSIASSIPAHTGFESDHLPKSGSLPRRARNSAATRRLAQARDLGAAPPLDAQASTNSVSGLLPLASCLPSGSPADGCRLCGRSLLGDAQASARTAVCSCDTAAVASVVRSSGKDVLGSAYPYSTTASLKPKDLLGIPWMLAFALRADGWWLRSDIIWHKPNPMPESVTDRPTKSHEYLFLLTKAERYFYDAEAIKEALATDPRENYPARAKITGRGEQGFAAARGADRDKSGGFPIAGDTRNKRSVWTIATAPFAEAHFATFPPELPEICIKAGTSQKGCCAQCGAPWERETAVSYDNPGNRTTNGPRSVANREITAGFAQRLEKRVETTGWSPSCSCNAAVLPCTVLDPFAGAGTTLMVADRLQRHGIGIELNPTYAAMAQARLTRDRGDLLELMESA